MDRFLSNEDKKKKIIELTSLFLHKHYCENSMEPLIEHLDDEFTWLGTAEHEYAVGRENVAAILRSFSGRVPECEISNEVYDVIQPAADVFVCSGTLWICTAPSSLIYLRVHQRVTTVFRWSAAGPRCCHMHISNPYTEMMESDIGFPEKMSQESRRYFQEQIEIQKKQIEEQHAFILQMYSEDISTGLYNRNKFNHVCETLRKDGCERLGIAYFDLNGLKQTNDLLGHQAGDDLIRRTAAHLIQAFGRKAYRIGGDEFIIIDTESGEDVFQEHVRTASEAMHNDDISIAHGTSWRAEHVNIDEQINEADKNMYLAKKHFYERRENNRRKNRN